MKDRPWTGTWVAERLGVALNTRATSTGLGLPDLVGMAVRRNPRRAHLLVSTLLGKHVPTDPVLTYAAGRLLGVLAGQALSGHTPHDHAGGRLIALALAGDTDAAPSLLRHCRSLARPPTDGVLVLGYAETATGLGHCVAAQLRAPVLHSTRRTVPGIRGARGFEEEHSHASSHLLLAADENLLAGSGPMVLVDDEVSTGTTALNTIRALHTANPRQRYVIATLVDLRSEADRARMNALATELCASIDVVALSAGTITLPDGVLAAGRSLADSIEPLTVQIPTSIRGTVTLHDTAWPPDVLDGGRHGMMPVEDDRLVDAATALAQDLAGHVAGEQRLHVLGVEEFMYAPLLVAQALASTIDAAVTFSTTTRSPALVLRDPGYAIGSGITFPAHDNPDDGPGPRFAYNLPTGASIVLIADDASDTAQLHAPDGLIAQLRARAPQVVVVTIPCHRPAPAQSPD